MKRTNTAKTQETDSTFNLSEREWSEIRSIARGMFKSGNYGDDQFRIAIQAFCIWAENYERMLEQLNNYDGARH